MRTGLVKVVIEGRQKFEAFWTRGLIPKSWMPIRPAVHGGESMEIVRSPWTALFHDHTRRNTTSVRMRVSMFNVL